MEPLCVRVLVPFDPSLALTQHTTGDPEAGREVAGLCQSCHGLDGSARGPDTPHIVGEPAAYLAGQLRAYRSGERAHDVMSAIAASLTDRQIEEVAAWYASLTATPVHPEGYSTAAAPEGCLGCHGADGIARMDDMPNLTGDSPIYLEAQLRAFASGERPHDTMTFIAQRLSDEELAKVVEWYSSIGLEVSGP